MYTFSSRVRYSEMDHPSGTLKLSSIINYFQDCSTFQSEDSKLELSNLHTKNRLWLLTSWQLQIKHPALLGEFITVGTWAYDFKGFYGYRNFIMKDEREEILSVANSVWVYIDAETGRPIKVPTDASNCKLEQPYPMEYTQRKVELWGDFISYPSFPVIKSNIDSYNHVNNGQYIKMAEEFLPENSITLGMRVEYKMQAVLGDIIVPKVSIHNDYYTVVLTDLTQKPYAIIEFQMKNNEEQSL